MNKKLRKKIRESLSAVLPIAVIVLLLNFTIAPMPNGMLMQFLAGTIFLIFGMGLFTLGADVAMMPMGERIGAQLTKSRSVPLLIVVSFSIGAMITMAEPDLQVLANQVPSIPNSIIVGVVALGVGGFLVIALLRILFQVPLAYLFMFFYALVFVLAIFTSENYLAVAFDAGGVTTGPITVPFILALGVGVAAVRGGKSAHDDSFGLVAICSIGPILAIMIMGMFFDSYSASFAPVEVKIPNSINELINQFASTFPLFLKEVAIALLPIIVFFIIFQILYLKLPRQQMIKMSVGIIYTYVGLVLFLTGVNVGFMPVGNFLGGQIASLPNHWIIVPIGAVIGFFVVIAEPAVHVLNDQVEEISGGAISKKAMLLSLSIGIAISIALAMLRLITGTTIWSFILPGYVIALTLTITCPKIFTAIAFDSGGVASGPMTATFLLPFAMGACEAIGGNVLQDAFGLVAMVAMTPLIMIQLMGLIYTYKVHRRAKFLSMTGEDPETGQIGIDDEVIEFNE